MAVATVTTETPIAPVDGRYILASGEVTGHHHALEASPTTALYAGPDSDMHLLIKEGEALLRHEEHGTITLPPGSYVVRRQREWSEAARRAEWVMD